VLAAALLVVAFWPTARVAPASAASAHEVESEFVDLVNEERVTRGLEPLDVSPELQGYGRRHSGEMRDQDRLHHSDFEGVPNWKRLGENVGTGGTAEAIHEAFMESDAHRHVLLGEYVELGVGVVVDGDTLWVTELFRVPGDHVPEPDPVVVAAAPTTAGPGYRLLTEAGTIAAFGAATHRGSPERIEQGGANVGRLSDLVATTSGAGYWALDEAGGVFSFGDAAFHGSRPSDGSTPSAPAVSLAAADGGYWILDRSGHVFPFGEAAFHGSLAERQDDGSSPQAPALAIAPTPDGGGYWILDGVGGVFSFGNAHFRGSLPQRENATGAPAAAIAATPDGDGYWIATADGGVFAFGTADDLGSAEGAVGDSTVVDLVASGSDGYWVVTQDGRVIPFGNAEYEGSIR